MGWTDPNTAVAGDPWSASDYNTYIRDNLAYLHSGKPLSWQAKDTGGPYSTNSASLADIDATNLSATLSLTTGRAHIALSGSFYADAPARLLTLAIDIDGVKYYVGKETLDTNSRLLATTLDLSGLTPGSHTFKLQWKVGSGTAYMFSDTEGIARFSAFEL